MLSCIIVDYTGHCSPESREMRSAFDGGNVIGIAVYRLLVCAVVLHCDLNIAVAVRRSEVNRLRDYGFLMLIDILDE